MTFAVTQLPGSGAALFSEPNPLLMVLLFVGMAIVPFVLLSVTSFIKLSVVFGILRNALGAQQVPSGAVIGLLSFVLTAHIMMPVIRDVSQQVEQEVKEIALTTPKKGKKNQNDAFTFVNIVEVIKAGSRPVEEFLRRHSDDRERIFFSNIDLISEEGVGSDTEFVCAEITQGNGSSREICRPSGETFFSLVPAFVISELKEAFAIGFTVFLPFLVVDLVIAHLLVGLGMLMVSPVTISLPFKIILFVLCDGWFLLARGLVLGLSGVYLALRPKTLLGRRTPNYPVLAFLVTVSIIFSYQVITRVPFRMWDFTAEPINYLRLALWYVALIVPFFFAGLLIAELLTAHPRRASRLYGVDLVGAAMGSLLLIPIIPLVGGEGTVVCAAIIAALAGLCFSSRKQWKIRLLLITAIITLGFILPQADSLLPMRYHQNKRVYNRAVENNRIVSTRWSPLSKVDIATRSKDVYDVWIDGGTNQSAIIAWSGNEQTLQPQTWSSIGLAHMLRQDISANVMIIGPAGGKEVLFSLSYGAAHIDAVELDPSIVHFVNSSPFKEFNGGLFQKDRVNLVNDEGRAFLRRQPLATYDIVQFVNNYTPVAIAAGALNLSETFLITVEAFHDYLDHLKPNGILALHRGATLRVALTAIEALRERGVKNPEQQIMITAGEVPFFEGFLLKNGAWTKSEERAIHKYMSVRPRVGLKTFLWTPFDPERDNLYSRVLSASAEEQKALYTRLGINLFPATDDRPFIEHYLQFGKRELAKDVPIEFVHRNNQKWRGIVPRGDFPYVAILVESAVLGLLFVGLPLLLRARNSIRTKGFFGYMGYFSSLGFGFIVVEICLMKRYVLFLGNPAYSITTILVALLLGAGLGSIASEKLSSSDPKRALNWVIPLVAVAIIAETLFSPLVFDAFLGLEFAGRIAVATLMLLPLGFLMGMPFPLGLRLINRHHRDETERTQLTAWAWGMNGYTTVIGSAATVFIALFAGFKVALLVGVAAYLLGLFAIRKVS